MKRCVHQQRGEIMKHFANPVTLFFIVRRLDLRSLQRPEKRPAICGEANYSKRPGR
jgi:hypothetical protein